MFAQKVNSDSDNELRVPKLVPLPCQVCNYLAASVERLCVREKLISIPTIQSTRITFSRLFSSAYSKLRFLVSEILRNTPSTFQIECKTKEETPDPQV